uniref:THAP domain-containing protein 1 n=1 Tax=Amphilophus citrinellus TaxID=61819 RepID=A0A3Q0QRF4_AMPCI
MPIKCYCSVPFCSNSKRKQPHLSFHDFPKDKNVRVKWITAIRRKESAKFTVQCGNTYVCSQHFRPEELYVRVRLLKGSVPSRFAWNDLGSRRETRQTPNERTSACLGSHIEAAMGERDVQDIEANVSLLLMLWSTITSVPHLLVSNVTTCIYMIK